MKKIIVIFIFILCNHLIAEEGTLEKSNLGLSENLKPSQYIIVNDLADFVQKPYENLFGYQPLFLWTVPTIFFLVTDDDWTNYYEKDMAPDLKKNWSIVENMKVHPDKLVFDIVRSLYVLNLNLKNEKLNQFTYCAGEAMLDGYWVSQGLKHLTGRARPYPRAYEGSHSWFHLGFKPDGPYTSFPSTHGTVYYAMFTVLGKTMDNELLGDVLGHFTFWVLLADHQHWISDMWVSYLLGKSIGNYVWEKRSKQNFEENWFVYPIFMVEYSGFYPAIACHKVIQ